MSTSGRHSVYPFNPVRQFDARPTWHDMNMGVVLIFFAILKTDGDGFHMQGCHDVPANFGHKASKPALLLHVQVVEASYVPTGSNHNVARRQGLRRRHSDPILAGDPGVVWRSRAKEQFRLCDHSTLAHATPRSLGEFGGRGTATDMAAYRSVFGGGRRPSCAQQTTALVSTRFTSGTRTSKEDSVPAVNVPGNQLCCEKCEDRKSTRLNSSHLG